MKLLFAIKGLVIEGGGAERVFVEVVNAFAARGHDVQIVTFDRLERELFYEVSPSVPVHRVGFGEPGVPTPRWTAPITVSRVRKLAKEFRPDVTVAFMHSTYVPVAFGLAGTGVPLILSEHTAAAHFAEKPLQRALVRFVQKRSYAKTVVSQVIRDEHPPEWRDNVVIVPNPVDLSTFARAHDVEPEKIILCVGGLRVEKRQDMLISAFERIADDRPEWRLRLVGDGATRPQIEAQVAASRHAGRIEIAGIRKDVASEYARAAIVAMPSAYEALPMAAIEAMASARPVVGFADCAGARTLIDDGMNGLLVEPGPDPVAALSQALASLMDDGSRRRTLGGNGPQRVAPFGLEQVADRWEELLSAAAQHRPLPLEAA